MVKAEAYQKYKAQEISMASPTTLIVMLYNECIKRLRLAQISIDKKDYEQTNTHLKKSQDIISELLVSLDFNYPIANELMALYDFMLQEIKRANALKNKEKLDPLIDMLSKLRDSWAQVEKQCGNIYEYGAES